MKKVLFPALLLLIVSCKSTENKEKFFRVEQHTFYTNGVNDHMMWHDTKMIAPNTYSVKLDSALAADMGIDSMVFKIVEQEKKAY